LFAYGPADANASPNPHHLLPHLNPDWFYLSSTGLPRLSWKKGKQVVVVVAVEDELRMGDFLMTCTLMTTM